MIAVSLPATLPGAHHLADLRRRLVAGMISLDWSAVREAPPATLAALLGGLDPLRDVDALGLGTATAALLPALLAALGQPPPAGWPAALPAAPHETWTLDAAVGEWSSPLEGLDEHPSQSEARRSEGLSASGQGMPSPSALRAELEAAVLRDLLGPANGPDEEVAEGSVRERYLVGLLAPRGETLEPEQDDDLTLAGTAPGEDGQSESTAAQGRSMFPSSLGLTFCVLPQVTALRLTCRWGRYERVRSATLTNPDGEAPMVWKRTQVDASTHLPLREGPLTPWIAAPEQPKVSVQGLIRSLQGNWIVTLFLVNGQQEPERLRDSAWLFQPELAVEGRDGGWAGAAIFRRRAHLYAEARRRGEDAALAMAYREMVEFAVGHGVAVHARIAPEDPQRATRIATCVVPAYEVPRTVPPAAAEIPALATLVLDMKRLAEMPAGDLLPSLQALPDAYATWLAAQQARVDVPDPGLAQFGEAARDAMARCAQALARIRQGLALLADPQAAEAFRFMNRAMWLQRTRSLYAEAARRGATSPASDFDQPANRTWFPFQLAFILINLPSLTDLRHPDRAEGPEAAADLLWFPTGGGKTEAYLGLTAYTLGIRRLQGTVAGHDGMHGVAVLMRYTLRLLTLQQFQRAAALICACEVIRREALLAGGSPWGAAPFRIGLWVGQRLTPGRTDQSAEVIKQLQKSPCATGGIGSPIVLISCPWCGTRIDPRLHVVVETAKAGLGRTLVYCGDPKGGCPFAAPRAPREGLPVLVVDEEIYRLLPSLLVATVDKFAQMPWNGATAMLFGRVTGYCPRHGFRSPEIDDGDYHPARNGLPEARSIPHLPLRPPDLIIQDELHLISGPLGTLVGLYETAVDRLATWEVEGRAVRPKVIASTATVRQAAEQIHGLFMRRVEIFPPQALDASDTFFARQHPTGEHWPGRRYLGICAPGRRLKAVLIRVYVAHLAAAQGLYERYGAAADPWMTLVGYFNSIRELGGMRRLVEDDVRSRLRRTGSRNLATRRSLRLEELTSRRNSTDIPELLNRLELPFDPLRIRPKGAATGAKVVSSIEPLDVLLATNMISVGVDVKRLGLMVVAGQPKSTSEYIQATSRVGRSHPGLVCTVFNWARPRDLSHYERFEHFHATFYQHVEALSVTPFAPRAIDRGLAALLVSLVRLGDPRFNENAGAAQIRADDPVVEAAIATIAARAEAVGDPATLAVVLEKLRGCLDAWVAQATAAGPQRLGYSAERDDVTVGLLHHAGTGPWETFTLLNSLREVEPTIGLVLDDAALDDSAAWPAAPVR